MSDLEQIVDGVEPETVEATPQVEVSEEPVQEPEQEPETPEVTAEPEPKPEATVPLAALLEVRQELQSLKALATPKPEPVKAPDVFDDPQWYQKHMQNVVQQAQVSQKLEMSRFMAEKDFGKEQVDEMFEHFNRNPEQSHQFLASPSPFHAAMESFQQQKLAKEIGKDPVSYRAKIEAEVRAKVEAELVAKQAKDLAAKAAPSMANVTGTGGGPKANWTGPTDLSSVIPE